MDLSQVPEAVDSSGAFKPFVGSWQAVEARLAGTPLLHRPSSGSSRGYTTKERGDLAAGGEKRRLAAGLTNFLKPKG